jgi:hypothetical protein
MKEKDRNPKIKGTWKLAGYEKRVNLWQMGEHHGKNGA